MEKPQISRQKRYFTPKYPKNHFPQLYKICILYNWEYTSISEEMAVGVYFSWCYSPVEERDPQQEETHPRYYPQHLKGENAKEDGLR